MERPKERVRDRTEEPTDDAEPRALVAIARALSCEREPEKERDEDERVRDHHDEQPRADDEATCADESATDGGEDPLDGLLRLPRLGEARREPVDEVTVFRHAEVTAILAREPRQPRFGITNREAARD